MRNRQPLSLSTARLHRARKRIFSKDALNARLVTRLAMQLGAVGVLLVVVMSRHSHAASGVINRIVPGVVFLGIALPTVLSLAQREELREESQQAGTLWVLFAWVVTGLAYLCGVVGSWLWGLDWALTVALGASFNLAAYIQPWGPFSLVRLGLNTAGLWLAGVVAVNPFLLLLPAFCASTTWSYLWYLAEISRNARQQRTNAALALSEEKLRIAQELHDSLGQNLAAISIKAELARALSQRGDHRIDEELAELQQLCAGAATEMRQVVGGYRQTELPRELASAAALLQSAEISIETRGEYTSVRGADRELAAWFIREAATNVLRHSDASKVIIRFEPHKVSVWNNRPRLKPLTLGGLRELDRRAQRAGAQVKVQSSLGGFEVSLTYAEKGVGLDQGCSR